MLRLNVKVMLYVLKAFSFFKQNDFVGNDVKYLMKILEEEGSLCNISEELKHMNVLRL